MFLGSAALPRDGLAGGYHSFLCSSVPPHSTAPRPVTATHRHGHPSLGHPTDTSLFPVPHTRVCDHVRGHMDRPTQDHTHTVTSGRNSSARHPPCDIPPKPQPPARGPARPHLPWPPPRPWPSSSRQCWVPVLRRAGPWRRLGPGRGPEAGALRSSGGRGLSGRAGGRPPRGGACGPASSARRVPSSGTGLRRPPASGFGVGGATSRGRAGRHHGDGAWRGRPPARSVLQDVGQPGTGAAGGGGGTNFPWVRSGSSV